MYLPILLSWPVFILKVSLNIQCSSLSTYAECSNLWEALCSVISIPQPPPNDFSWDPIARLLRIKLSDVLKQDFKLSLDIIKFMPAYAIDLEDSDTYDRRQYVD